MSVKNKLIPKLRFPEFVNEETWAERKLSDVLFEHKEKSTGMEEVYSVSVHKGVVNQVEHLGRIFAASNTENYKRVLPGDIIYTKSPTGDFPFGIIKQSKVTYPVIVSPLYGVFTSETPEIGFIIDAYFESPERTINYLSPIVQKGAKNTININNDTFLSISLVFPIDKSEQKKIVSLLSSLDKLIEIHNQKLDTLKEYKKGVMQNIFPQEGQKVPNRRFSEFINYGEWELLDGDNLFDPISNKNHNSDLPILAITQEFGAIPREMINYTVIASEQSIASYKVVEEGDFIISLRSFQGGIEYSNYKGICSPAYIILRKKKKLEDVFFKFYFKTDLYIQQLNKNLEGIRDGKMVSYKQFSEIKLPFPTFNEQQKIASYINSLEELIIAHTQKIETLKEHKKGLIQSLFPNN